MMIILLNLIRMIPTRSRADGAGAGVLQPKEASAAAAAAVVVVVALRRLVGTELHPQCLRR